VHSPRGILSGRLLLLAVLGASLACSRGSQGAPRGAPAAESTFARAEGVRVVVAADGFTQPVFLAQAPGDPRLFVVEQPGRIRWIENGRASSGVFLDLRDRVSAGGERGLLGLAFHPDYAANGWFYVNYTDRDGDTQVVRYTASGSPRTVNPASAHRILSVDQPYANHNGGMIAFGPDRMLWIGMGDGGAGGDPHGHGQNPRTLLAKMLRLDVDHGDPYAIPDGNPYKHRGDQGAPELWALGLRNPWRFSFDRATGNLIIGDVGQNQWEEIDVSDSARPGLNYGWNLREGSHRYGRPRPSPPALVAPAVEYDHDHGCSVTGGYAYRGAAIPALAGTIFFSDYCRGWLRSFRWDGVRASELREWNVGALGSVTSFGEDQAGELHVLTHEGRIWKLAAR
jgi:glucose/arabinose dehydrogenase